MRIARSLLFICCIACAVVLSAQDNDKPVVAKIATSKLGPMNGLPGCMNLAVQHGDPTKGPSVILIKMPAGCSVPWHWHTAAENLTVVSGQGKLEMKDGKPQTAGPGDYVFLPAKHHHQFTAVTAVTFFDMPEGAFDIHYVDASGNEIPPDQALKAKGAAKKAAPKK